MELMWSALGAGSTNDKGVLASEARGVLVKTHISIACW